jgi:hypothetical protein
MNGACTGAPVSGTTMIFSNFTKSWNFASSGSSTSSTMMKRSSA